MSRTTPASIKRSVSKTCLQEKTNLYKTTRSRSQKHEHREIVEKSVRERCNMKASGDRRHFSHHAISNSKPNPNHTISNSKPNTEIQPLDYRTANKVLAAFARHVEEEQINKHLDESPSISTSTYRVEDRHDRQYRVDDRHDRQYRGEDRHDRQYRVDDRHDRQYRVEDRHDREYRVEDRHDLQDRYDRHDRQKPDSFNHKLHNKRIAIISDDHKIAITPNVAAELHEEMREAQSKLREVNVNDNQGFPCTYKLKTDCKKKSKNQTFKPNKKARDNYCRHADTGGLFPERKTQAVDKRIQSRKEMNNQYLAIVPASDINLVQDKQDMVYGPFYFVKKSEEHVVELVDNTLNSSEPQITETSIVYYHQDKTSSKTEVYEEKPLDNNKSKANDDQDKQTLIKQSVKSSPPKGNVQWAFAPRKIEREQNKKLDKLDRIGDEMKLEENDLDIEVKDHEIEVKVNEDSSLSEIISPTLQSQDDSSTMKYMKANVEFLIGVGLNDVKVIGARRMR